MWEAHRQEMTAKSMAGSSRMTTFSLAGFGRSETILYLLGIKNATCHHHTQMQQRYEDVDPCMKRRYKPSADTHLHEWHPTSKSTPQKIDIDRKFASQAYSIEAKDVWCNDNSFLA